MPPSSRAKDETQSPVERLLASIRDLKKRRNSKGAHFYRTSLRRFQSWSDIAKPELEKEQEEALKLLEKLRKATGKLRDSEVHLELLDKIAGAPAKEQKRVEKALKSQRKSAKQKLLNLLSKADLKQALAELRQIGEPPAASPEAGGRPLPAADQLALDQYRAFIQSRAPLAPENLHSYRLACKGFRYTAELAGETAHVKSLVEIWKKVQDVSGDWHDYLVLSELAEEISGDTTLHSLLIGLRDKKYDEAVIAIEEAERKLAGKDSQVPKKEPTRASGQRRRRAV